jgi:hypothetical protein
MIYLSLQNTLAYFVRMSKILKLKQTLFYSSYGSCLESQVKHKQFTPVSYNRSKINCNCLSALQRHDIQINDT